jgi:single-strand DNA-binding protein
LQHLPAGRFAVFLSYIGSPDSHQLWPVNLIDIMRGLNKVTLIGNLGKEPEYQQLDGNVSVAKFSLATTESFKDKNGQTQYSTDWHTVVLWRNLAELAGKYLQKGSLVYIEGKLKTRSYDDRDGNKRYVTEVVAEQIIMLDKRTDTSGDEFP